MILTVLVAAFLAGRWWAIPVAALVWVVMFIVVVGGGAIEATLGAALLAAANAAIGVASRAALNTAWWRMKRGLGRGSSAAA